MSDEIQVPVWTSGLGIRVLRDSLHPEHPDSTYNYIKNVLGKNPEDYGYYCTHLTEQQKELLSSIPDDALFAECRRREQRIAAEEMYGSK
jgi:urease alpha subunit